MSVIAVSDTKMSGGGAAEGAGGTMLGGTMFGGGVGLQPGLESKVVFAVDAKTIFNLFTPSAGPPRQVTKSSQPLFLFFPGPTGLERVAVLTWPPGSPSLVLFLHDMLLCPGPSPQPCVEQNFDTGLVIQLLWISACS